MISATEQRSLPIAIIGGGIIGTSIALVLQRRGFQTALFDPEAAGAGAVSGSASYISVGEIFPLAHRGLLFDLPRMLFDPLGPLVIRPSYLPKMFGWGMRFLRAMSPSTYDANTRALASLNRRALPTLQDLAESAGAANMIEARGGLLVCEHEKTLREAEKQLPCLQREGIDATLLSRPELHEREPALAPHLAGALFFPGNARCVQPRAFAERLAAHAQNIGTQIIRERVAAIEPLDGGGWRVRGTSDRHADRVIIAAGVWSGELLQPLGYRVPIETERGYHLQLPDPNVSLIHPMVFQERHFAVTPLSDGIRLAGTVEFAGTRAPMNPRRSDILYDLAKSYVPGLRHNGATRWMGFRPSFPDSLPAIGKAARYRNLFYCFGHQHLGLTQAGISAEIVADIVEQRTPAIDVQPFRLERF